MEDKIKGIIEREFNANVLEVKRITEGYSHHMYEVKINKEPNAVIIRFSNNKKESVNLGKEKYVMELLEKNNVPTPKIYAFTKDYLIMEKLKGTRLDTIWDSLSKQEKIQITKEIGKLLAKIHSIKLEKFGNIEDGGKIDADVPFKFRDMGKKVSFSPFLREWLKESLKDLARLLSYEHIQREKEFLINIFSYLLENLYKVNYIGEPTFTHGDFIPGHIFVEKIDGEYKIVGIIDFEFSQSYCPEYDFIKLHRQGFFEDVELKKALEEGYGRKIDKEAVELYRIMRDLGFAWAVLEAGNKELSDETIKKLEEKIKNSVSEI